MGESTQEMNYKILVASCDNNSDLFEPFHLCIEKYWPDHPEIIYSTETKINPYYKTICLNYSLDKWTKRIKDTISTLECDYILLMVDDLFIREKVDNNQIEKLESYFRDLNIAGINLEASFDKEDTPLDNFIMERNKNGKWEISVLCYLYKKEALMNIFDRDCSPWEIENIKEEFPYSYLITKEGNVLNWKDPITGWRWGLVRKGKWVKEAKNFFDSENINIDYSKRGFFSKSKKK